MNNLNRKMLISNFWTVLVYAIVLTSLSPIFWLVVTSLKSQMEAFSMPPIWLFQPKFGNYIDVLSKWRFLNGYKNSLIVSSLTVAVTLLLSIPAGYGIAHSKQKKVKAMGLWMILLRMAPPVSFLLPLYVLMLRLGIKGTYWSLLLVYLTITVPFVTWLMIGFFETIPEELSEAAMIDGASRLRILLKIELPLALPGLTTGAIFSFMWTWNEFLYALIMSNMNTRTVPVVIQGFVSFELINWGALTAGGIMVIAPVLIFSLLVQRGMLEGFRPSAFK